MERIKKNGKKIATIVLLGFWAIALLAQNRIAPGPNNVFFRVATATDTTTLTTGQVAPGILLGTPTTAATYTLPTAANLCSAWPGVALQAPGTNTNFGFAQEIRNISGGANTITIAANSGVTLAAGNTNTIAQNHTRVFIYTFTSCAPKNNPSGVSTVTVYSGQDSAH